MGEGGEGREASHLSRRDQRSDKVRCWLAHSLAQPHHPFRVPGPLRPSRKTQRYVGVELESKQWQAVDYWDSCYEPRPCAVSATRLVGYLFQTRRFSSPPFRSHLLISDMLAVTPASSVDPRAMHAGRWGKVARSAQRRLRIVGRVCGRCCSRPSQRAERCYLCGR